MKIEVINAPAGSGSGKTEKLLIRGNEIQQKHQTRLITIESKDEYIKMRYEDITGCKCGFPVVEFQLGDFISKVEEYIKSQKDIKVLMIDNPFLLYCGANYMAKHINTIKNQLDSLSKDCDIDIVYTMNTKRELIDD